MTAVRIRHLLPVVWLLALLLLPGVAWLLGMRQPLLENREKTPFPRIDPAAVRQADTFRELDAAIRERLPLRREAIDIRGRTITKLFGESSNADVILGRDEWLYYRPELRICEPTGRPDVAPADAVEVLARTIAASGRHPVVIVAGSKINTHRAHLKGVSKADLDCLSRSEAAVQTRLGQIPGGHSIQAQLDAHEAAGRATFLRSDTHWNALGREVFLNTLLDGVRPGLADEVRLRAERQRDRRGDLGALLGQKRTDLDPLTTVTRKPAVPFAPGEVAIIGDSQMWNSIDVPGADGKTILDRVFPGQLLCDQYELQKSGCVATMLKAKTVVLESVARNYEMLTATCWRPVAALAATMRGTPATWAGGSLTHELAETPSPARIGPGGGRDDVRRLVRIPVDGLPAEAGGSSGDSPAVRVAPDGAPRPCALTRVPQEGYGQIVIPVAAGERIADLELRVSGPAGSSLGRPEVLYLGEEPRPSAPPSVRGKRERFQVPLRNVRP